MNTDFIIELPLSFLAYMSLARFSKQKKQRILQERRKACRRKDRRNTQFRRNEYALEGCSDIKDKRTRNDRRNYAADRRKYERRALVRVMKST